MVFTISLGGQIAKAGRDTRAATSAQLQLSYNDSLFKILTLPLWASVLIALSGCNFSSLEGKCHETGLKLSDREILDAVISEYLFRRGGDPVEKFSYPRELEIRDSDLSSLQEYGSPAAFIEQFPDCCSVSKNGDDGKSVDIWDDISKYGIYRFVSITYSHEFTSSDGSHFSVPMRIKIAVNKCGDTTGIDG